MIQPSFQGTDGEKIGQGLRGMLVAAVAGIDDGNTGFFGGYHGRAFFWMPHGADIGVTGNDADGIGNAFPFGSGRTLRVGKT